MSAMTAAAPRFSVPFLLDWIERLAVAALFGWVVYSKISSGENDWFLYLYCASEGLVVAFILARRATDKVTPRALDWALAIGATILPMLTRNGAAPLINQNVATMVVVTGIAVQLSAKLMLMRSFGIVAANRGLKLSGPYRFVRHPMYAGYLITHIGIFMTSPIWWNFGVYALAWTLQIARLFAEERLLKQDPAYVEYAQRVRFRLIPGLF